MKPAPPVTRTRLFLYLAKRGRLGDLGADAFGDAHRFERVLACDERLAAIAYAVEEMLELENQRLGIADEHSFHDGIENGGARAVPMIRPAFALAVAKNQNFLTHVVHGDIPEIGGEVELADFALR